MLDTTDAFTLVPEAIERECGLTAAVVWGVVWRYCQMGSGVCWASQAAIGRRAGLRRETVGRHLRRLVEAGYLRDLSPDAQGRTHTYADTGRARIGRSAPAPERTPHTGCANPAHGGERDARSGCDPGAHLPVRTAHTKRASKRVMKRGSEESQQDTCGVAPPVGEDHDYGDDLDDQDGAADEGLLQEPLAQHFARLTGIAVPQPRSDRDLREAQVLWSGPLARIAAACGSAPAAEGVMAAALAILREKRCIVKAPISLLGTAEALAGQQAVRRRSLQEINQRYAKTKRGRGRNRKGAK